ncbi:MAG: ATP-binding protein [Trichloromonas sp.]|nr:ATP-binding protein [Trichloromonas sp.]
MPRKDWITPKYLGVTAGVLSALVLSLLLGRAFLDRSFAESGLVLLTGLALLAPGPYLVRRHGLPWRERRRLETENTALRQAAEEAQQRFQQLFDNAGDAIFFIHPETGAFLDINRRGAQLLGYPGQSITDLPLGELFPGRQRRRYLRLVKKVLRDGYGEVPDLLIRRRDGRLMHGELHARLGDLGKRKVVHCVLRDVSEMHRIEAELRQKNRDLALVNDIAHQAAGSRDAERMLDAALGRVLETFSADGGGIFLLRHQGRELHLLVHRGIEEPALSDMGRMVVGQGLAGRVAASGMPRSSPDLRRDSRVNLESVRQAGWRGYQAVPLVSDQRTVGVLFFFTLEKRIFRREEVRLLLAIGKQLGGAVDSVELYDALQWQHRLTEASNRELEQSRLRLRDSLRRMELANRALEQTERLKSNFITLASHELRTPLTYILSGSELLAGTLRGRLTGEEQNVLRAIHQGGQRLHEIVQDLLDMARIEANACPITRGKVHLPTLLTEVEQEFQTLFRQRDLSFRIIPLPTEEIHGDARQLGKTFHRLVENAVKFTPEGGAIEISGSLLRDRELRLREAQLRNFSTAFFTRPMSPRFLQLSFRDTGVGIDPAEQVRIFDKFYEIGPPDGHFTSRTSFGGKGVGLGLSLVKGVVEAHGGMAWVESPGTGEAQRGSAFHLLLPLDPLPMEGSLEESPGLSGHSPA